MSDAGIVEVNEQGIASYRASSIYSCHNALLLARLGYDGADPPAWMQQRFNAGHEHEPLILRKLIDRFNFFLDDPQAEVVIPVTPTARVVGHVDALHHSNVTFPIEVTHVNGDGNLHGTRWFKLHTDDLVVVDAKALSQTSFDKWMRKRFDAFPYYAWQQRAYMLATGAAGLVMAVKNKNTDDFAVEYFTDDYMDRIVTKKDIVLKVMQVEAAARKGQAAIFATPCTPMFPCPYYRMHPADDRAPASDVDETDVAMLASLRMLAKKKVEDAQAELDEIDDELKAMFGGKEGKVALPTGTVSVYRSGYASVAWPAVALAAGLENGDEAKAAFTETKKSDRLSIRITPKREKKGDK